MKKKVLILFSLQILFLCSLRAQTYTIIPDSHFEQALIDLDLDTILDGKILTSNIDSITTLNIIDKNIDSLNGIQDFINLASLDCSYNNLMTLDLSNNTALTSLSFLSNKLSTISINANMNLKSLVCASNQLDSLIISNNTSLKVLNCSDNRLKNLDLSSNKAINELTCSSNQLDSLKVTMLDTLSLLNCSNNRLNVLDVSQNSHLKTLLCASNQMEMLDLNSNDSLTFIDCSNNQLNGLNVSNNKLVSNLSCSANKLTSLNLTQNDSLTFLSCANNQILSFDLSKNDKLSTLICASNQLGSINVSLNTLLTNIDASKNLLSGLDVSDNDSLTSLNCSNNQLEFLNIKNGTNNLLSTFYSINNPKLFCIKVDNEVEANNNAAWRKDDIARYNEVDCIATTYVPDDQFEQALIDLGYDSGPLDNFVPTSNISAVTKLVLDSLSISNLTGLDAFINLDTLDCSSNNLYNLNVSQLSMLRKLDCSSNNLIDIVLTNEVNGIFKDFNAIDNPDLNCILVYDINTAKAEPNWLVADTNAYNTNCSSNKTYIPDDNFEQALIDLGYDYGSLDNYVVTDSINKIKTIDLRRRNIFSLAGIEGFAFLEELNCSENSLGMLDVSALDSLRVLSCFHNYLTSLDVSSDTLLTKLSCGDNYLSSLDLSKNLELLDLECNGNNLKQIDVSVNSKLRSLNCNSNDITNAGFNVSSNDSLLTLYCSNNNLDILDLANIKLLKRLDFSNNHISSIDLSNNDSLEFLDCSLNKLTSLSLTDNKLLVDINANSNQIHNLNVETNTLVKYLKVDDNQITNLNINLNDSLRKLSVSSNQLANLDLNKNSLLGELDIDNNLLDSLSVKANDSLKILKCSNNFIPNLNLSKNIVLRELTCNNNLLDSLILKNSDSLVELSCSQNNLEIIDISNNLLLSELVVDKNKLPSLDVSANVSLERLNCSNNLLQDLNISSNSNLTALNCLSNELTSLILANGNNANLVIFNAIDNPDLTCIEVDDETQIGDSWNKDATASFANDCFYGETYIPDDNFEAALSTIIGEASNNNDNYIPTTSIEAITTLDISNKGIADLTGIQHFTALSSLNTKGNVLDSLDVSRNINLISLVCANNQLDSLDLSKNTALEILDISANQFKKFDLSKNIALKAMDLSSNQLAEIDLSKNTALEILEFSSNQFTEIDISHLTALTSIACSGNLLNGIDLSNNGNLSSLNISSNQLTTLHGKNGNNSILSSFDASNNPLLYCIEVDDPGAANAATGVYSSWITDPTASFSDVCHYGETYVPDDAFEQALKDLGYDGSSSSPLDDYVPTSNINSITVLNVTNKGIADLKGIEAFTGLQTLNCSDNLISNLDLKKNLALTSLRCSGSKLTSVDIIQNSLLTFLDVSDNLLTTIDVSANLALAILNCSSNQLTALDIVSNTVLGNVNCSSNHLVSLDANNANNATLTYFDLRQNSNLTCILVDDINASAAYPNWFKDITAQYKLVCNDDDNDGVLDVNDHCLTTSLGDKVDLFGCSIFILPADNFSIFTTGESCRSSNNGKVNIDALSIYNYTATIIGNGESKAYNFTNSVEIRNLRAANYELCLTIAEEPDYSRYYEIVITQPEDLAVQSQISPGGKSVSFNMSGANMYTIDFNGLTFNTADTLISLSLKKGNNTFEIRAESDCQGIYNETIFVADDMVVFPNPFDDYINIYANEKEDADVFVEIYSLSGKLVFERYYFPQNGLIRIETPGLKPGIYYVSLKSSLGQSSIKIIKK